MELLILLSTLTCIIIGYYLIRMYDYFTYWQKQGIKSHRFVHFDWARMPFHEYLMKELHTYGRIHGDYSCRNRMLIVNDARIARELSIREFHKFPVRYSFHIGTSNLNKALFFMTANDDWKRVRSIVTPAFTTGKLKAMLTPIERIVGGFIEHLRPFSATGEEFDIKQYTSAFAMDVIASCAYGIDIDSLSQPDHPIVTNAKKILGVDASLSLIVCLTFPKMAKLLRLEPFDKDAITYFDKLTFKIIETRMKMDSQENRDLIGLMMESAQDLKAANGTNHVPKSITKEEISGQGILFFIAGFDTTNSALCHAIYYLTKYPQWQERLYEELRAVRGSSLDYEVIKDLPVLNAIIDETLRLNPSLLVFERESTEECYLPQIGLTIPKNSFISIQPYVIHRDPEYFPDPECFKPDRFLDKTQDSHQAYMPFGLGPRLCVGMRFALNELRVALANLVLHYKLLHNPNLELEYFNGNILMTPKEVLVSIAQR